MKLTFEWTANGKVRLYINGNRVNKLFKTTADAERYAQRIYNK